MSAVRAAQPRESVRRKPPGWYRDRKLRRYPGGSPERSGGNAAPEAGTARSLVAGVALHPGGDIPAHGVSFLRRSPELDFVLEAGLLEKGPGNAPPP